jgi:serine phosphatase RsbU (regulator of sigma subunit)/ligand-binding sensor domain-containing protein
MIGFVNSATSQNKLRFGRLPLKNFPRSEYSGQQQNFGICESKEGTILIANKNNIIEYNGTGWAKIKLDVSGTNENTDLNPRSLYKTNSGTILVGCENRFGLLTYDEEGRKIFKSLSEEIDEKKIGKIWNIYGVDDQYYFIGNEAIFCYSEDGKLETFDYPKGFERGNSSELEGSIFFSLIRRTTASNKKEYTHLVFDTQKSDFVDFLPGITEFHNLDAIKHIMRWKDNKHYLAITQDGQAYSINELTNEIFKFESIFDTGVDDILISIKNYNGLLFFSTEKNGVFIFDELGQLLRQVTAKDGLIDDYVNYSFLDSQNNLWCATANGVSLIELSSPISYYSKVDGITSKLWDIAGIGQRVFLASNDVFSFDLNKIQPKIESHNLGETSYAFSKITIDGLEKIMVVGHNGIYSINENFQIKSEIPNLYAWCIKQSKVDSNRIYIGSENGIASAKWNGTKFDFETFYPNSGEIIHSICEFEGKLYHSIKAVGPVFLDTNLSIEERTITGLDQETVQSGIYFEEFQNELFLGTSNGLYLLDKDKNEIVPFGQLGLTESKLYVHRIFNEDDKRLWLALFYNSGEEDKEEPVFGFLEKNEDGVWKFVRSPFRYMSDDIVQGFIKDREGNLWLGADGGAYVINTNQIDKLIGTFNINCNKFWISSDSSLFENFNQYGKELPHLSYDNNSIKIEVSAQSYYGGANNMFRYRLIGKNDQWSEWTDIHWKEYQNLSEGTYTIEVQARDYYGNESEILQIEFTILPPWYRTWWAYVLYIIGTIAIIWGLIMLSLHRVKEQKKRLEKIVKERTAEIAKQNEVLAEQKDEIEVKNKDILDSIKYAKRIQDSILPPKEVMDEMFTDYFVLFKPKDIVSGDFYWAENVDNKSLFAAVDCTGHGVPGAMVSVVGNNGLNRSVKEFNLRKPGAILDKLREIVIEAFNAKNNMDVKDGMDIALCSIDYKNMKLEFSGANNPCIIIRDGEILETKADKQPIGQFIRKTPFINHEVDLIKGDTIYVYSDGYVDQFGGEKGKKLKSRPFKNLLVDIQNLTMEEQGDKLDQMFEEWRGKYEQIDDVCVFGVKI